MVIGTVTRGALDQGARGGKAGSRRMICVTASPLWPSGQGSWSSWTPTTPATSRRLGTWRCRYRRGHVQLARALLRMDQDELARRANVSIVTVRRLEAPDGISKVSSGTFDEVRQALEVAGAEFIDRGVRKRQRSPEEIDARGSGDPGDCGGRCCSAQGCSAICRGRSL
jgi:hypothetical protein